MILVRFRATATTDRGTQVAGRKEPKARPKMVPNPLHQRVALLGSAPSGLITLARTFR